MKIIKTEKVATATVELTAEELGLLRFGVGLLSYDEVEEHLPEGCADLLTPVYVALLNAEGRLK